MEETGTGYVHEKEKALLAEIIARVNDLFEGDLTDGDRLVYVNDVLKGSCWSRRRWSSSPSTTRRSSSPTRRPIEGPCRCLIDAFAAHQAMSKQALDSPRVREGLEDVLLGPAQLYEALLERANKAPSEADG
jgi:type I restriction enzyme R subunit